MNVITKDDQKTLVNQSSIITDRLLVCFHTTENEIVVLRDPEIKVTMETFIPFVEPDDALFPVPSPDINSHKTEVVISVSGKAYLRAYCGSVFKKQRENEKDLIGVVLFPDLTSTK